MADLIQEEPVVDTTSNQPELVGGQEEGHEVVHYGNRIPDARFNDLIAERNTLRQQFNETTKWRTENEPVLTKYLEFVADLDKPEYASVLRELQIAKGYAKPEDFEIPAVVEEGEYTMEQAQRELKELRDWKSQTESQGSQEQFNKEFNQAREEAQKLGIPFKQDEVADIMLKQHIESPLRAYNVWKGMNIEAIKQQLEVNIQKGLKTPPEVPIAAGKGSPSYVPPPKDELDIKNRGKAYDFFKQ